MISLEYFVLRLTQKMMNRNEKEQTEIESKETNKTYQQVNIHINQSINNQLSEGIEEKMQ